MTNLIRNTFFITAIAILSFLWSCQKDKEADKAKPDGVAFKNAIKEKREANTQTFTVDMTNGQQIVGNQGTTISFSPGSLVDQQGNTVTGDIEVKLLELYKKSDMVLMNKSTMGRLPDGKKAMLVSGGAVLLNATQNGEDLKINGTLNVNFPVGNTGGADHDMTLFTDCCDNDCDGDEIVCKEEAWDEAKGRGELFVEGNYYISWIPDFGWTNVDKFFSDPRPKTTLLVDAPDGYDNTNCAIYLSYDGENGLAALDTYLSDQELFSEHYGQIPIGLEVHIIAISVLEDGGYAYTIKGVTIADGETIVLDDLTPVSETALIAAIENLP